MTENQTIEVKCGTCQEWLFDAESFGQFTPTEFAKIKNHECDGLERKPMSDTP